jgi:hypothetical protein
VTEGPWPGVVPGVDVSLELKADLITAKGGAKLEEEIERRPRRRLRRPLRVIRRRRNPPDPRDAHILSPREVKDLIAAEFD